MIRIALTIVGLWLAQPCASQSNIVFAPNGQIATVELSGQALGMEEGDYNGFALMHFNGTTLEEIPLESVKLEDDDLLVSSQHSEYVKLAFKINKANNYLAINLIRAEGIPMNGQTSLRFGCTFQKPVEVVKSSYFVDDQSRAHRVEVYWPYLWHRSDTEIPGGFAFFASGSDAENDECLAAIWANEPIPHPDTGKPWTKEAVFEWIERYRQKFAGLREATLSVQTSDELYELTDRMHAAGINRIYLHTDTWRGEYWPRKRGFTQVNESVFPDGVQSLTAYGKYLKDRDMMLRLHNVSGGVGRQDPDLVIGGKVSRSLMKWVDGCLAADISDTDTVLTINVDGGGSIPNHLLKRSFWDLTFFRIGEEIVQVSAIDDIDKKTWRLRGCKRAMDGSAAGSHSTGTSVSGMLTAYGQNYVPNPDSALFEEMAFRYADFLNEVEADHQHYDGYEIHNIPPWGSEKFSYLVANRLNKPTTTSTSGGKGTIWQMERRFSAIKKLNEVHGYWAANAPVLLAGHRRASSMLDAHYEIGAMMVNGARRVGLYKPEPMFGVSKDMLDGHGLSNRLLKLAQDWGMLMPAIDSDDMAYLNGLFQRIDSPLRQRGNHFQSRDVPVLDVRNDGYYWVPTRVMVNENEASPWIFGQEFGASGPRQFVAAGDTLLLTNPNRQQEPGVILRVLGYLSEQPNTARPRNEAIVPSLSDDAVADYRLGADLAGANRLEQTAHIRATAESLFPDDNSAIVAGGISSVALAGRSITIRGVNGFNEPLWSEELHASWDVDIMPDGRTALEVDIVGDSSNAVVVIQLMNDGRGVRDYVAKIDFNGPKRIVIPTGEVAWTDADWGWRFGAKHFDYFGRIAKVRVGLGMIPAKSKAKIELTAMRLLHTLTQPIEYPVLRIANGKLRIMDILHPGEYFTYNGGSTGSVFNENWQPLRSVAVENVQFIAPNGKVTVSIEAPKTVAQPWFELQLTTEAPPYRIHGPVNPETEIH